MGTKKNLVMGSGRGYSFYVLETFMRSFVKNVKDSDMVLFVDDLSDFTCNEIKKIGKEIQTGKLILEKFPETFKAGHPANTRWKMFLEYIKKHGSEYAQILCVDTRDAFFQGDIFKDFDKQGEYVGTTYYGKDQCIGKSDVGNYPSIRSWIDIVFGKEEADKLADKRIFCPSTIMGTSHSLEMFLTTLCENIPDYDTFGADECTLDYIIHHDMVPVKNHIEIESMSGEIMHLNLLNVTHSIKTKDNFILNPAGKIPKVVHAYDTNLSLLDFTDKIYRSKNYSFDERFKDNKSILDQLPHLIFSEKYEDALKIFMDCLFGESTFAITFNAKDQAILEKMNFSALTEEDKKALKTVGMKGYGDTLIRMWEVILEKNSPITHSCELVELAIQRSLTDSYAKVLPLYRAEKICGCIKCAETKGHLVSTDFKNFVLEKLFERAKVFVDDVAFGKYISCMELIFNLNMPLDEKWRKLKNEAHTRFVLFINETHDEKAHESALKQIKKGKIFYLPYRIDADFENGGLK